MSFRKLFIIPEEEKRLGEELARYYDKEVLEVMYPEKKIIILPRTPSGTPILPAHSRPDDEVWI